MRNQAISDIYDAFHDSFQSEIHNPLLEPCVLLSSPRPGDGTLSNFSEGRSLFAYISPMSCRAPVMFL
ncbi:unnamed protein product, partial [Musa textilis]